MRSAFVARVLKYSDGVGWGVPDDEMASSLRSTPGVRSTQCWEQGRCVHTIIVTGVAGAGDRPAIAGRLPRDPVRRARGIARMCVT